MKYLKRWLILFYFYSTLSVSYTFNIPANQTLVLRLINHSTRILTYAGVAKMNLGNFFFVTPKIVMPGGAATIVGITSPYTDLAGKVYFHDDTNYNHLLHIVDPRMINFKRPVFSINNENLISFVKPKSFTQNENQSPGSIAYTAATIVVENNILKNSGHVFLTHSTP
jgi:hypothetical protein